jgi:hypothetical protein
LKTDAHGAYKVGKTKGDVSKRIKGLQTANVDDIEIMFKFRTSNPDLVEKMVHVVLDQYRCNNREFFECKLDFIKIVTEISCKMFDTLVSMYDNITENEVYNRLYNMFPQFAYVLEAPTGENNSDFSAWLNRNIRFEEHGMLGLSKVVERYTSKR